MSRIQNRWLRATDVFHIYYDMTIGGHQARRGGTTISKAVHLAAKNTKSLSTCEATFWSAWKAYKDVATAVTATVLIWDNTRRVFKNEYLAAFRTHDDAEDLRAVFASSPYYRAHRGSGIIMMLNGFCCLSYRYRSA
jgi:hypothetical protein